MIVMADGDLAKNQFHLQQGYPLPLGYDQYTRQSFGNKDLLLNAMNYLCDETGLITVRSRELKLRLLDGARVEKERLFWQLLNTIGPVLLVILTGFTLFRIRKSAYSFRSRK
jgi:ABC-2 type transport system permease protein